MVVCMCMLRSVCIVFWCGGIIWCIFSVILRRGLVIGWVLLSLLILLMRSFGVSIWECELIVIVGLSVS